MSEASYVWWLFVREQSTAIYIYIFPFVYIVTCSIINQSKLVEY